MAKVTKDMIIADVLRMDRNVASIFMEYGMHCIGCPVSSGESIAQAAVVHNVDADALVKALNDYFESKGESK